MTTSSLYDKYGGFGTVSAIVHTFYDRVLVSPRLSGFFDGVNTQRLIQHQTNLFCMLLGGPAAYDGRELAIAHAHLDLTHADFDEVAEILQDTLEDAGVEPGDVATLMGVVAGTRADIVATAA